MSDLKRLYFKRTTQDAYLPTKATHGSAGYDLYSEYDKTVFAGCRFAISVGVYAIIPRGYYGRIASRSSLAMKGIDVGGGVIDSDYRGVLRVILINNTLDDFKINAGERIAQLIVEKIYTGEVGEIWGDIESTDRGFGGFGSTGV